MARESVYGFEAQAGLGPVFAGWTITAEEVQGGLLTTGSPGGEFRSAHHAGNIVAPEAGTAGVFSIVELEGTQLLGATSCIPDLRPEGELDDGAERQSYNVQRHEDAPSGWTCAVLLAVDRGGAEGRAAKVIAPCDPAEAMVMFGSVRQSITAGLMLPGHWTVALLRQDERARDASLGHPFGGLRHFDPHHLMLAFEGWVVTYGEPSILCPERKRKADQARHGSAGYGAFAPLASLMSVIRTGVAT
ncbi:hypothetical protein [Falsiroseomonas sp.]|uniref:hypothetical protein n=1 Tax=Falsiroseomonas sp. TaxID=2870721 RepID=UPI003F6F3D7C